MEKIHTSALRVFVHTNSQDPLMKLLPFPAITKKFSNGIVIKFLKFTSTKSVIKNSKVFADKIIFHSGFALNSGPRTKKRD